MKLLIIILNLIIRSFKVTMNNFVMYVTNVYVTHQDNYKRKKKIYKLFLGWLNKLIFMQIFFHIYSWNSMELLILLYNSSVQNLHFIGKKFIWCSVTSEKNFQYFTYSFTINWKKKWQAVDVQVLNKFESKWKKW